MASTLPSSSAGGEAVDAVAIGAGPANLSLAALARPIDGLRVAVLERKPSFSWHPGSMFSRANVTTTPLKDLVSLVDPTNPLSFLNFLALHGRLYRHLITGREAVLRREFAEYFSWAASQCESVRFAVDVEWLDHDGEQFVVATSAGTLRAPNVVLGVGQRPAVPELAKPWLGPHVFHAAHFLDHPREIAGRDVLLVGGGQSAAEVALTLLDGGAVPRSFTWVTNRHGFLPLDDSPFSNEWFNPRYTEYFQRLPAGTRERLLQRQTLASDGASQLLLQAIYSRLYELDYLEPVEMEHRMLTCHELVALRRAPGSARLEAVVTSEDTGESTALGADTVVLATGYEPHFTGLLERLGDRIPNLATGDYEVGPDYSLAWDGPGDQRIFVQGAARRTHGIADPNLSLVSWRSAVVLNAICGHEAYPVDRSDITLALGPPALAAVDSTELAMEATEGGMHG